MTYADLINQWFIYSTRGKNIFTKYIFLYISFCAFLSQPAPENDRNLIERVKNASDAKEYYINLINNDPRLRRTLLELIGILTNQPILNSTPSRRNYWNGQNGVISGIEDWSNLVEFWYRVRNNLFHGHKSPDLERDQKLVTFAYKTLRPFMKNFIDHGLIWDFR